jgi:HK97 gp10 family phage protein
MANNFNFKIEGMDKLLKDLEKIGNVPQKHVTSSSRKAMNVVLKQSRATAPYDEGYLEKGMKLKGERSRAKGKKVYQVIFNPDMNHIFQKPNKEGKITGYYPVSQEYGFFAKNGRYIPGYRFIHDSLADNTQRVEKTIVSEMQKKIDAEIAKAGLK